MPTSVFGIDVSKHEGSIDPAGRCGHRPYEQVGSCLLPDLSGAPAPVHDMKLAGQ